MMDKDFDNKEFDKLLKDWEENRLSASDNEQLSDKLIDFVDEDIDIEEMLDAHIHNLAIDEKNIKSRRKRIGVISAAATVALLISAVIFFMKENTSTIETHETEKTLMTNQTVIEKPIIEPAERTDNATAVAKEGKRNIDTHIKRANKLPTKLVAETSNKEEFHIQATPKEMEIAKTLSEIDLSFENLFGNTFEDLSLNETGIIPTSLFFDDAPDYIDDDLYGVRTFEINLINTFNEMKSYNINLNFETNY